MVELSHVDEHGRARMVDVSAKQETVREAIAQGEIRMRRETLELIVQQREASSPVKGMAASGVAELKKGDVFGVAQVAGILAAKRTWELIPMCHQLLLTGVSVDFSIDFARAAVVITGTARTRGTTGVEMEALVAVSMAALTIYDMVKAVDQSMTIGNIQLVKKTGGKSDLHRQPVRLRRSNKPKGTGDAPLRRDRAQRTAGTAGR